MTLSKRSLADLTATAASQAERVSKATREEAETRCTAILGVGGRTVCVEARWGSG
jgi:hypothetical protein